MRRGRGFTLIEIMVAGSILAIVSTLVWGSFRTTFSTKQKIESQAARYRTVRLALDRLARDLSMAYVSQNEDTSQPERRTRFIAKQHSGLDEVLFSYFGHQRLYQDSNEADTALVSYYAGRSRQDGRKTDLYRRETRRLSNLKIGDQAGESDVVCDDIVKLKLEYWDPNRKEWTSEWNSTQVGQGDRVPAKARITLTVHDERGQEVPFQTQTRLALSEPLNNQPRPPR